MATSLAGLPDFLIFFVLAVALVGLYLAIYTLATMHNEFALIRENVISAATALGFSLVGFALPLASAIVHAQTIVDCLVWGLVALAVQIVTGLWLAEHLLGSPTQWFDANPVARTVQVKLALLAVTVGLALHARLRVVPRLSDATLPTLAWHIRIVTLAAVLFVLAGASIRFGGYPVFER